MITETIAMSVQELDRLAIMEKLQSSCLTQVAASQQLGLSTRQIRRLQRRHQQQGAAGLVSKRRCQPSNHRLDDHLKSSVVTHIQSQYADFGPTLAHEKLTEQHGLSLSVESVRQLMIKAGLWAGKRHKSPAVHQRRPRRTRLGELVQIDGSPHDWFEGRSERVCSCHGDERASDQPRGVCG